MKNQKPRTKKFNAKNCSATRKVLVELYRNGYIATVIAIGYEGFTFYSWTFNEIAKGNTLYLVLPRNEISMRKILSDERPLITVRTRQIDLPAQHELFHCVDILEAFIRDQSLLQKALENFSVVDSAAI